MSGFLTKLVMECADGDDDGLFIVVSPLVYQSDIAARTITVPVGFCTDLASVPRLPFVYLAAGGTSAEAATVHDYLYSTGLFPREVCDAVLREAQAATHVPWWRRQLMYLGVRLFGGSHYAGS